MHEIRLTLAGIDSKQISQKASNSPHACRLPYIHSHSLHSYERKTHSENKCKGNVNNCHIFVEYEQLYKSI